MKGRARRTAYNVMTWDTFLMVFVLQPLFSPGDIKLSLTGIMPNLL